MTVVENGNVHTRTINMNRTQILSIEGRAGDNYIMRFDGCINDFMDLSANQNNARAAGAEGEAEAKSYEELAAEMIAQGNEHFEQAVDEVMRAMLA